MGIGTAIGVGSSLLGGRSARKASKRAAGAQERAAEEQRRQYEETKGFYEPYRALGEQGVANLGALAGGDYSGFEQSPGYQFRLGEGIKARENTAAARGMSLSGGQMKALTRFGQDYGAQEYGNYFERQRQLAGIGSSAISQGGQQGAYGAAQAGRFDAQAGQLGAAGILGQAGAYQGGLGGIGRQWGLGQGFGGGSSGGYGAAVQPSGVQWGNQWGY